MLTYLFFATMAAATVVQSDNEMLQVKSHRRSTGRITNGTYVLDISEFPYQVGIASYDSDNERYWCGGSLISNEWIVTAAHCLAGKVDSEIYLGVIDKFKTHQFQVPKTNYVIHKNFNNRLNDIALIKLPVPVNLTSKINTITVDKNPSLIKWVNKYAVVSGWGASVSGGQTSRQLKYAEVKILSNSKCIQTYGAQLIKPSHICQSVINNKGICQGDSGGPLVVKENGVALLIGITSFISAEARQCEIDKPRVFTRVASYHQWICENTEKTVC